MIDCSITTVRAALAVFLSLLLVHAASASDMSLLSSQPVQSSPTQPFPAQPFPTKAAPTFLPETSTGQFWAEIDYLGWKVQGDRLPALVTTSPAGTPTAQVGVLGAPGTTVLFGDGDVNSGWRSGAQLQAGYWFDRQQTSGVEASAFGLENLSSGIDTSSSGNPALARPVFNTLTSQPDALLLASPGRGSGAVMVRELSRMLGAGALYHQNIFSWGGGGATPNGGPSHAFGGSGHIGVLIGYRYRYVSDRLDVASSTTSGPISVNFSDSLNATNNFHGLDVGLSGDFSRGAWSLEWRGKVALGANLNDAHIGGATISSDGMNTTVKPGGLLAPPNALGDSSGTHFAVIPEINLKLGYKVTQNWQVVAGYNAMYWSGLQRAGDLVNASFDSSAGPPPDGQPPGPGGPPPNRSSLLAQGFSFGLKYAY